MNFRTYAWAARGLENRVYILYAGLTMKETKKRFASGYDFKRLNNHRFLRNNPDKLTVPADFQHIDRIRKCDIHLVHEEEIKSKSRCVPTVARFKEQIIIETCRAVADYLEKELNIKVACGNAVDSVGVNSYEHYVEWIKSHKKGVLGGPEIDGWGRCRNYDKELYNELIEVVKGWQEAGAKKYNDEDYMKKTEQSEMYAAWRTGWRYSEFTSGGCFSEIRQERVPISKLCEVVVNNFKNLNRAYHNAK
jgi:hypothetical protein